jgi:hypothetical protein
VPGHQWLGKQQRIKKTSATQKIRRKKEAKLIESVERLLSTPYLTLEEEECQVLAKERRAAYIPKWKIEKQYRWLRKNNMPFNASTIT